jgi:hypothetical protein
VADDKNSTDKMFLKDAQADTSATLLFAVELKSRDFCAKSIERQQPMCYTRANNGTAPDMTLAVTAGLAAAKEES